MDKISSSTTPSPARYFDSHSADNANGQYQSYKVLKNEIAFSFLHSGEDEGCQVKTVFLKLDDFRAFLEKKLDAQDREDYLNHVLRPCTDLEHSTISTITPILTVAKTLPEPSISKPEAGAISHASETWSSTAHSTATIRAESTVAAVSNATKSTTLQEAIGNVSNMQTTVAPKELSAQTSTARHSKSPEQTAVTTADSHASSAGVSLATPTPSAGPGKTQEQTAVTTADSHASSAGAPLATPTPSAGQSKTQEQTAAATADSHASSAGAPLATPTPSAGQGKTQEQTAAAVADSHASSTGASLATPIPSGQGKTQEQTAAATADSHASSAGAPMATPTPSAGQGKTQEQTAAAVADSHASSTGASLATPIPSGQGKTQEQTAAATAESHASSAASPLAIPTPSAGQSKTQEQTEDASIDIVTTREKIPGTGTINVLPSLIDERTSIPALRTLAASDIISPSEEMAAVSSTQVSAKQPLPPPTPHSAVYFVSDSLKRKFIEFLTYERDIHAGYQKEIEKKIDRIVKNYSENSLFPSLRQLAEINQLFDLAVLTFQLTADAIRLDGQSEKLKVLSMPKSTGKQSNQLISERNSDIITIRDSFNKKLKQQTLRNFNEYGKQMLRLLEAAKSEQNNPETFTTYDEVRELNESNRRSLKRLFSIIVKTMDDEELNVKFTQYENYMQKVIKDIKPLNFENLTPEQEAIYLYSHRIIESQSAMFRRAIEIARVTRDYVRMQRPKEPKKIISQSQKAANMFIDRFTKKNIGSAQTSRKEFIENFRKQSDDIALHIPETFVGMFSIYGMKMKHAINGMTNYLGRLMIRAMENKKISSKERRGIINKILLQKNRAYKAALDEIKALFFHCIEIRKKSLTKQNQDVLCEGQIYNYPFFKFRLEYIFDPLTRSLKEKISDHDNSMFNIRRLFKQISQVRKDELSTIESSLKLSQSLKEKDAWSCITTNNQTEQTLKRQSKIKVVQERIVKEFSSIAKVCAALLTQIGFDLHFRLKDPDLQAYQDRPLLPYDFSRLIDNQPRKRRDLSDTDDMGSTNEPIDENDIINEVADDDDNTAPQLMDQSEPGSPLSSGASMHRGVWSAIGSQLAGLAQYAGLTTANQPTSLNELPRKMDEVNDTGAEPAEHASSSKPVSPLTNDSLILANIVASALNDRPIRAVGHHHDSRLNQQASLSRDPLAQSPGMRLIEGARGVASQLHTELNDYVQSLADDTVADIAPYWQPQDLLNIAIVQTAGVDRTSPTKAFLQAVIASPALGVEHESPDNIFRSDGTVRKVDIGADGRSSVFYDSVTGKTTTGSPSIELARCMLRAMAQHQLENRELSKPLRKQVLDQVLQLQDRRSENSTLSTWLGLGGNDGDKDFRHDFDQLLTEQVGKLRQPLPVNDGVGLNPLVQSLNMGNYQKTRHQFINLAPDQQISMIRSLANAPDILGLDQSSEFIAQLLRDIGDISGNDGNEETPDWSAFAISQRTWQLFTWLYDCKVTAFDEAFSRQQLSLTISERQIAESDDETWRLNEVITDLLPTKSSASDRASIESGSDSNLLPPVQCHRFDDSHIDKMLDAYSAIKNQVNANFPRVFGDTVSDPLLKQELTGLIATACLEVLKGKLTANPDDWQALVDTVINEEFVQFTEHHVV